MVTRKCKNQFGTLMYYDKLSAKQKLQICQQH